MNNNIDPFKFFVNIQSTSHDIPPVRFANMANFAKKRTPEPIGTGKFFRHVSRFLFISWD